VRAVVFDFDGLIVDTETPIFRAWQEEFTRHGAELTAEDWAIQIGTVGALDPIALLRQRSDDEIDEDEIHDRRRTRTLAMLAHEGLRPGVTAWLDACTERGLATAVSSSSTRQWVAGHLRHHGLTRRFRLLSCFGTGLPPKPAPDLYSAACRALGVAPFEAVALEDSPNGVAAAKEAGMHVISVANPVTDGMDLGHADHAITTLADQSLADAFHHMDLLPVPADPDKVRVLPEYVTNGRLARLPSKRQKLRIVLDAVVQCVALGDRIGEPELNDRLRAWSDDTASLRRHLVDEGFLGREAGVYWRTGGTVNGM